MELKDPWVTLESMDDTAAASLVSDHLLETASRHRIRTKDQIPLSSLADEAKAMIAACEYFLQQTTGEKPTSQQLAEERLAFKAMSERHQKLHLAAATAHGGLGLALVNMHLP